MYFLKIINALQVKTHRKHKVLGILDIYGFEAFEQNGFEQFIINFSNEKVQQLVIDWAFRQEQEDIIQEGLDWTQVHLAKKLTKIYFTIFFSDSN
jgi:myosin-1